MNENTQAQPITTDAMMEGGWTISPGADSSDGSRTASWAGDRARLYDFIAAALKPGSDYGVIMIKGKPSKPTLFKPGGEKLCWYAGVRPHFRRDTPTWEMAGSTAGTFCYLCVLLDAQGRKLGEGRGACTIGESMGARNANSAIKIAQKRAQVDATLRLLQLSDYFTQDLEDTPLDGHEPDPDEGRVFGASGTRQRESVPPDLDLPQRDTNLARIVKLAQEMLGLGEARNDKEKRDVASQAATVLNDRARRYFKKATLEDLSELESRQLLDMIEEAHRQWKSKQP